MARGKCGVFFMKSRFSFFIKSFRLALTRFGRAHFLCSSKENGRKERTPHAHPLSRIPSVLAFSGSRRKLAHKPHSLKQRLALSASCSAPRHRLRGLILRESTYLVGGETPSTQPSIESQTGNKRALFEHVTPQAVVRVAQRPFGLRRAGKLSVAKPSREVSFFW